MLSKSKISSLLISISLISGFFSVQFVQFSNSSVDLLVTMEADKSSYVQVASSDWSNQRNSFYTGKGLETLSFKNVRITDQFILKPSFVTDNLVTIHSIEFIKKGRSLYRLKSYDVVSIDPQVRILSLSPNLQLINPDGFAQVILNVETKQALPNRFVSEIFSIFKIYDFTPYLTIGVLFLLMLGITLVPLQRIFVVAITQAIFLGSSIYFASKFLLSEYSVSTIVGKGGYLGLNPKLYSQVSLFLGGIYLALLLMRTFRLGNRPRLQDMVEFKTFQPIAHMFFSIVCFILYVPRILTANQNAKLGLSLKNQPSWDLENIQTWEGLFRRGWDPNIDFWYPYGARIFLNQYPTWLELLNFFVFLLITLGVTRHLFPRIKNEYLQTLIQLIFFITLITMISDPIRLGLPILGIFVIATIRSFTNFQIWIGLLWTLICVLFGSDVFVYWMVSLCVFHVALTFSSIRSPMLRSYVTERIATFHLRHLFGLSIIFLVCGLHPFSRQIISLAFASAKAGEASSDPVVPVSSSWLIWSSLLILNCVLFWIMSRLEFFKFNGVVLTAIFATSVLHLAKMGTRPVYWIYSFDAIILISTLCVMLYAQFAVLKKHYQVLAGFLVGVWLCFPNYNLSFGGSNIWKSLTSEIGGEFRNPKVDFQNFSNYDERKVLLPFTHKKFYVYGDSGYIYVMAGQKPYWQTNLYNSALLTDQKTIISKLKADKPKYVIIDKNALNFDLVPHYMRNPQLLRYILLSYKFERRLNDQYWILVSKNPSEVGVISDVSKLAGVFGSKIDLGWVATNYEGKGSFISCSQRNNFCGSILLSQGGAMVRELDLIVESNEFKISLFVYEFSDDFKIPLDFVWPISGANDFDTYFDYETTQEKE